MQIDMLSVYAMYVCISGKCGRLVVLDRAPAARCRDVRIIPLDLSRGSLEQDTDLNEVLEKRTTTGTVEVPPIGICYIPVESRRIPPTPQELLRYRYLQQSLFRNTPIHTYIYDISFSRFDPIRHILLPYSSSYIKDRHTAP